MNKQVTPPTMFFCKHCRMHKPLTERVSKYKSVCISCQLLKALKSPSITP